MTHPTTERGAVAPSVVKMALVVFLATGLLVGCSGPSPTPVVQLVYVTSVPPPTSPPLPTYTPYPTQAPPTAIPTIGPKPVSVDALEAALSDAGYKRSPFYDERGQSSFSWMKYSDYEWLLIWPDGTIRLNVLDVRSPDVRKERIERQFKVLDSVFTPAFMAKLRQENDRYNATARPSVSGEPDHMYPPAPDDPWSSLWARYNASDVTIESYPVTFGLWFWQLSCPSQYGCYMSDFPGQSFTGDTSFVFYTIQIATKPTLGGGSNTG